MIVTKTVALMPQPYWDAGQALTTLWAGTPVNTFGITTSGTGPNGESCSYTYVAGNNCMGWVISSLLIPAYMRKTKAPHYRHGVGGEEP